MSGSGQPPLLTSLEIGQVFAGSRERRMGDMRIERLVARPSSNKDVSLKKRRAELLRRRIEELDRRLAILNSERRLWQRLWR